ncbi:MAG: L-asparaginase 2, partial [Bacillota bacterium]
AGNGSMSAEMERTFAGLQRQGMAIVRSTRVSSGIVARNGAVDDDHHGFIVADTLNPQKARILLMLALTKTCVPREIQRMFWQY